VGIKLGFQVTPSLRAFVGYDFLYWSSVMRAGGQIDTAVNPALLPPAMPIGAGAIRPLPLLSSTDVWVHGFCAGLELRY